MSELMRIPSPADLVAQASECLPVPDAFGALGGCWLRGYDGEEEAAWQRDSGGDAGRLITLKLAAVLLTAPLPDGAPLFGVAPDTDAVRRAVRPGWRSRLSGLADALAGYENPYTQLIRAAEPEAVDLDALVIADPDAVLGTGLEYVAVPDAFGALGGCWVRGYQVDELDAWNDWCSGAGVKLGLGIVEMQLAYCLLDAAPPAGKGLFLMPSGHPSAGTLRQVRKLRPGVKARLMKLSDQLSGFDSGVDLGDYPTRGAISASGAVTASDAFPASSPSPSAASGDSTSET